jgi:hypothetical protein
MWWRESEKILTFGGELNMAWNKKTDNEEHSGSKKAELDSNQWQQLST